MRLCETKTFNLPESTPVNNSQLSLLAEALGNWNFEKNTFFQAISRLGIILNLEQQQQSEEVDGAVNLEPTSATRSRYISHFHFLSKTHPGNSVLQDFVLAMSQW